MYGTKEVGSQNFSLVGKKADPEAIYMARLIVTIML
jgi:hypothetical protein